ncbi:hypothetical protein HGB07_06730 [Candidatus Roizmanbacteria bacterium]|nr:hypothetical protein [Candidatus Roizmanbacteria bacterium]
MAEPHPSGESKAVSGVVPLIGQIAFSLCLLLIIIGPGASLGLTPGTFINFVCGKTFPSVREGGITATENNFSQSR